MKRSRDQRQKGGLTWLFFLRDSSLEDAEGSDSPVGPHPNQTRLSRRMKTPAVGFSTDRGTVDVLMPQQICGMILAATLVFSFPGNVA